jgi:hypothetical protein
MVSSQGCPWLHKPSIFANVSAADTNGDFSAAFVKEDFPCPEGITTFCQSSVDTTVFFYTLRSQETQILASNTTSLHVFR